MGGSVMLLLHAEYLFMFSCSEILTFLFLLILFAYCDRSVTGNGNLRSVALTLVSRRSGGEGEQKRTVFFCVINSGKVEETSFLPFLWNRWAIIEHFCCFQAWNDEEKSVGTSFFFFLGWIINWIRSTHSDVPSPNRHTDENADQRIWFRRYFWSERVTNRISVERQRGKGNRRRETHFIQSINDSELTKQVVFIRGINNQSYIMYDVDCENCSSITIVRRDEKEMSVRE